MPIRRMRLPRGRHASRHASQAKQQQIVNSTRPSTHKEPQSHGSATNNDMSHRIRRLERMVTNFRASNDSTLDPLVNEV